MAVLYRTNSQSRVFEEALRKRSIPYVIHGGHSFYQRKEIKDVLSYFRLVLNHDDEEAFRRVINYPARGIGDTTMAKISETALRLGFSYWEVIADPLGCNLPVNAGTATKLANFRTLIQGLGEDMEATDAYSFTKKVLVDTGIRASLEADKTTEGIGKLENLDELLNSIHEFCESSMEETGETATISDFLQKVSLMSDIDDGGVDVEDKVTLMTVHAAKGLEFKNVFVVGLEEELFPSDMSLKSEDGVEEERRLFYVAITRAEENCIISYAKSRFRNGVTNGTLPSRFLKDIDEDLLDCPEGFHSRPESRGRYSVWDDEEDFSFSNRGGRSSFSKPWRDSYRPDPEPMPRSTTYVVPRNLKPLASVTTPVGNVSDSQPKILTKVGDIEVGNWVEHERFGRGIVLSIEGVGGDTKLTINFQNEGERKILLKYVRLKNLGK